MKNASGQAGFQTGMRSLTSQSILAECPVSNSDSTVTNAFRTGTSALPRLGFLGTGWIGRNRLEAIRGSGAARITAIADPCPDVAREAQKVAPEAGVFNCLEDLLEQQIDAVVIATPSALHAEQAVAALQRGLAVFCQKPLGRHAQETKRVVSEAQKENRLLGVDMSYRSITGIQKIRELCLQGELGEIFAVDLVFHNAYGPDKSWFYDRKLSGGGCLIDLGIHLVDIALWCLGFPTVLAATGRLFSQGRPLEHANDKVEDYSMGQIELATGATVRFACSWKLSAGCDAVISGSFYGNKGGANFRNIDGSFYDFVAEKFQGTKRLSLSQGLEPWGGRGAVSWAQRLASGGGFDPDVQSVNIVAEILDAIYTSAVHRDGTGVTNRNRRPAI